MEDCCDNNEDNSTKGGKMKIDLKKIILWIIIAILAIAVIYVLFFKGSASGNVISSTGQAAQSYGGMVGGC